MKNKKILIIIGICILLEIITFLLTRKIYYINNYNDSKLEYKFSDISNDYKINNEIVINTTPVSDNNYITMEDIRIRNDFADYTREIVSSFNGEMTIRYMSSNGSYFSIGITSFYLNLFNDNKHLNKYLHRKKINNDIDLIKLIGSDEYKTNFWTSAKDIIGSYNLYVKAKDLGIKNVTLIKGNYEGFMYESMPNVREVNLYKNNKRYVLMFVGNDFNLDKVQDLLNTINIA